VISDELMSTTFVVTFDTAGAAEIHHTSGTVFLSVSFGERTSKHLVKQESEDEQTESCSMQ